MKKILLLLSIFCGLNTLSAQDAAIFSHYHINPILINPAAAGFDETQSIFGTFRASWSGFPDAPNTYGVFYNGPIGKIFGLGAGINAETAAQMTRTRGVLNYAFRFGIKEDIKISAGFSTEFQQIKVDNGVLGELYEPGDGLIEEAVNGRNQFDAGVGAFATYRENTFVGLAFTNLVSARLTDISGVTSGTFLSYYTFLLGHKFTVEGLSFTLEPSLMVRQIINNPQQFDFNIKAGFLEDQLIAGLSYRSLGEGALGILLGTKISSLELFYTFDISFQEFQQFNSGSHEVTVAFRIQKKDSFLKY